MENYKSSLTLQNISTSFKSLKFFFLWVAIFEFFRYQNRAILCGFFGGNKGEDDALLHPL